MASTARRNDLANGTGGAHLPCIGDSTAMITQPGREDHSPTANLLTDANTFESENFNKLNLHLKNDVGYVVIFLKVSPFYLGLLVVRTV